MLHFAGDFDVPSSREDVDRDSSWNQWLRNEIHILFLEALEIFKVGHIHHLKKQYCIGFMIFDKHTLRQSLNFDDSFTVSC